jgi:hypothetical protein
LVDWEFLGRNPLPPNSGDAAAQGEITVIPWNALAGTPWDALTLFATIILIIQGMRLATGTTGRPTEATNLQPTSKLYWLWFVLAAIFLVLTIYLMVNRPNVQGPPGPAGKIGQPGPAGEFDPKQTQELNALARHYWAITELQKLEDLSKQWDDRSQGQLRVYFTPGPRDVENVRRITNERAVNSVEGQIQAQAKADFGLDLDLQKHPNFDLNRSRATPNDTQITDDEMREEYRRYYDQFEQTKGAIEALSQRYRNEIASTNRIILDDARQLSR